MHCSEHRVWRIPRQRTRHRILAWTNAILLVLLIIAGFPDAPAQTPPAPSIDDSATTRALWTIRDQARAIEGAVRDGQRPAWLEQALHPDNEAARRAAAEVGAIGRARRTQAGPALPCRDLGVLCGANGAAALDQALAAQPAGTGTASAADGSPLSLTIFASRSLGDSQLRALFQIAAVVPNSRIVFRGVAEDESLTGFMAAIHALAVDLDKLPAVELDPVAFRDHAATVVPLIVATGPDGSEIARVAGLANPAWLTTRIAAGERGDLGVRGPVREIAEPDLLEEIARRIRNLDLEALGGTAVADAFERLPLQPLPTAGEDRVRRIDPTIVAPYTLSAPDGTLIVQAGERFNPLDQVPFTQRLVVIDADDPRQLTFARDQGGFRDGRRTTFLLSGLDRLHGWDAWQAVEDALDSPVYLLTAELRRRFSLERVPAVVEADGRAFVVTETAMPGTVR